MAIITNHVFARKSVDQWSLISSQLLLGYGLHVSQWKQRIPLVTPVQLLGGPKVTRLKMRRPVYLFLCMFVCPSIYPAVYLSVSAAWICYYTYSFLPSHIILHCNTYSTNPLRHLSFIFRFQPASYSPDPPSLHLPHFRVVLPTVKIRVSPLANVLPRSRLRRVLEDVN